MARVVQQGLLKVEKTCYRSSDTQAARCARHDIEHAIAEDHPFVQEFR